MVAARAESWAGHTVVVETKRAQSFPLFDPIWEAVVLDSDRRRVGMVDGTIVDAERAASGRVLRDMLGMNLTLAPLFDFRSRGMSKRVRAALGEQASTPAPRMRFVYVECAEIEPTSRGFGLGLYAVYAAVRNLVAIGAADGAEIAILEPFPLLTMRGFFEATQGEIDRAASSLRTHWRRVGFRDVERCGWMVARIDALEAPALPRAWSVA